MPALDASDSFFPDPFPLSWASGWGEDGEYDLWMALTLVDARRVFRWIAPGRVLMGSPLDEPERYEDEVQHEVTLSCGFWLADTACTQEFWQAVTGRNPSGFKDDPRNPVEAVSWYDVNPSLTSPTKPITESISCEPRRTQVALQARNFGFS